MINLFCFPFAGGSKYSYEVFKQHLPASLTIISLELPGRGSRVRQPFLFNLEEVAADLFRQIQHKLNQPYAIYGHSMGTLIGYLITKKIIAAGLPAPVHLFMTGAGGPSIAYKIPQRHLLPREKFLAELKSMGGMPDAILNDNALLDFFEPILRADFEAIASYRHMPEKPFDIPITVMIGLEEFITYEDAATWQLETSHPVNVHQFPGKHFFIMDAAPAVMNIIVQQLAPQYVQDV